MKGTVDGRDDRVLLQMVLDHHADLTEAQHKAMAAMLYRLNEAYRKGDSVRLNLKQYSWLKDIAKKLDVVEPPSNLVSRGLVERGAEVQEPWILRNRPLKPPGR